MPSSDAPEPTLTKTRLIKALSPKHTTPTVVVVSVVTFLLQRLFTVASPVLPVLPFGAVAAQGPRRLLRSQLKSQVVSVQVTAKVLDVLRFPITNSVPNGVSFPSPTVSFPSLHFSNPASSFKPPVLFDIVAPHNIGYANRVRIYAPHFVLFSLQS